jgi:predicted RNA binding protein YcfA (HicA-like mRNA interferase family)
MTMKDKELVKLLERAGYEEVRQKGSHRRFECPGKEPVTIPWHSNGNDTLHPKIVKDCLRKAGLL